MNANFVTIIKRIIAEQGEAILGDPARLKGFIADYAKNEPKTERFAFGRCMEHGAYNALKSAPDAQTRQMAKAAVAWKVHDNEGLDIALCNDALDALETALFGATPSMHSNPTAASYQQYVQPVRQTPVQYRQNVNMYHPQPHSTQTPDQPETSKAGFLIGIFNLLQLIGIYLCRNVITLPEEDRSVMILAWLVVTIVLAITGFCISLSASKKNAPGKGFAVAGMALNGLIILPALVFFFAALLENGKKSRQRNHHIYIH